MTWDYWLVPFVIASRLPRIAEEARDLSLGRRPAGRFEAERMVTEKLAATHNGLMAAGVESMVIGIEIATKSAFGDVSSAQRLMVGAPARVAAAATAPAQNTMKANARRFSVGAKRAAARR
ncbi:hypothetical protein MCEMSEM23_03237 [Rhabdaerophilaceae bacterium]